jgi:hypothetical protein
MATQPLAKGVRFFDKHANSPDFVIGTIVLTLDDIKEMFNENQEFVTEYNGKQQLRLQQLKSKDGKIYLSIDTYKKDGKQSAGGYTPAEVVDDGSGLPF